MEPVAPVMMAPQQAPPMMMAPVSEYYDVSQYHIALLQTPEQELEITDGDEGTGGPNRSEYSGH